MKKSPSSEKNRLRPSRPGQVPKKAAPTAPGTEGVKLSPPRKTVELLEEHCPKPATCAVVFQYFNPQAAEVLVAGSFNGWQPRVTPMSRRREGQWSAQVLLEPGHYEYRFFVDGQWQDDPMAARFVANPFGGLNCVVEVQPAATAAPAANRH